MNFDKANTDVTRHSYGSRVDKEFKREGVIPVKNRNKNEVDYAAESAKYNELNKKVENRRFNDIKEQKAFDNAMIKGYDEIRESLLKDIMYEICIESMWVDRNEIDNNIRNIMQLVDEQLEAIGGYKGFKEIAESSNNRLLLNMVNDCEEMCKIIGTRNLMEAAGNVSKLDFEMNKAEMDEFDYRKKSFGSETIINAVRDKVLDVVKYEQEANTAKQEVMDEIQMKVEELGAPVGEAMEFIFNEKIEETTLFDSLMRKNYKNIIATESSHIFESKDVDEEDFEYEDDEFKMSDIELIDEEDDDDIKNMFLENAYSDIQRYMNESEEVLEGQLNSILETLNTMTACKSKSDAIRVKDDIRELQYALEEGLMKNIKTKFRAAKIRYAEDRINSWKFQLEQATKKNFDKIVKKLKDEIEDRDNLLKTKMKVHVDGEMEKYVDWLSGKSIELTDGPCETPDEMIDRCRKELSNTVQEGSESGIAADNIPAEDAKGKNKVKEEVILCPECKKDPCTCKGVKESFETITEGVLKNKIVTAYNKYKDKKLNKVDFEKLRNNMIQIAANANTIKELDVLDRDVDFSIAELEKMKKPENEEKVTFHIEFLNKEYKKFLAEKRAEMNKQKCVESFVDKLDGYCDKLSAIIEAHELARNSAVYSLTYEIEDNEVFVPFIQPNDCNLSNLEFAYKTKLVCESLKSELRNVNNENDFMIIEKAVDMNLQSINESLEAIKDMEKMDYKQSTLKACEGYLNKIKHVIDNNVAPNNPVTESTSVFGSDDDVERIFNRVKEYTLIESTNNGLMETVMAESIVEYTILEAFNTLNLLKFDKESVRRMSRNNIK